MLLTTPPPAFCTKLFLIIFCQLSKYTYPIALGPASLSHEEVERRFNDELVTLRDASCPENMFYSKIHGKDVRMHGELIVSLMDQPERRGMNYMMAGNSIYAARWGYTINLQEVHKKLVPCDECKTKIFRELHLTCPRTIQRVLTTQAELAQDPALQG